MKKIILAMMTVGLLFILTGCGKTKVNLNDYLTVTVSGYDTIGEVEYYFDKKLFFDDFEDKIKVKKGNEEIQLELKHGADPVELLWNHCINIEISEFDGLSNGDKVEIFWDCDDDMAEACFGVKLEYKDVEHTVSGLEEIEIFDPYEYVDFDFVGLAPNGKCVYWVDTSQPMMRNIVFSIDKMEGLDNGDIITVRADFVSILASDLFYEEYGKQLDTNPKEVVVEGLAWLIETIGEIPEKDLEVKISEFKDGIKEYVDCHWDNPNSLKEISYEGYYLLKFEKRRAIYFIFKISAEDMKTGEEFNYYCYKGSQDFVNREKGINWRTPGDPQDDFYLHGNGSFYVSDYQYYGFKTLEDLYNEVIADQLKYCEVESDISID